MRRDQKIIIPAKRMSANSQGTIKITDEAMECLIEVVNDTGLPARQAASIIITQAIKKDLIVYDREVG